MFILNFIIGFPITNINMRNVYYVVITLLIILAAVGGYWYYTSNTKPEKVIRVFSAGSLSIPLQRLAEIYKEQYNVDVNFEFSGSVEAVRKITDVGKPADVIAVADYRLIRDLMYPKYVDWYVAFASNEMVLIYTNTSKYQDELEKDPGNWYNILLKPGVKYGFSNPNKDPCGYRSLGVISLQAIKLSNYTLIDDLITKESNIKYSVSDEGVVIEVPADFNVKSDKLVVRSKSVDLISLVEAGSLDYAFEYKSVAIQHKLKYIELSPDINLKNPSYDDYYSKVKVVLSAGSEDEHEITIKSIVYGIAIVKNSENYGEALNFIKLLLSDTGRKIFKELGQDFLSKPIFYGNPPSELTG